MTYFQSPFQVVHLRKILPSKNFRKKVADFWKFYNILRENLWKELPFYSPNFKFQVNLYIFAKFFPKKWRPFQNPNKFISFFIHLSKVLLPPNIWEKKFFQIAKKLIFIFENFIDLCEKTYQNTSSFYDIFSKLMSSSTPS